MKKIKKIILQTLLYTICWRNVDKLYSLRHYDSYYIKLKRKESERKMILGFILGLLIGALLMYRAVEEERKVNRQLKRTINNLQQTN